MDNRSNNTYQIWLGFTWRKRYRWPLLVRWRGWSKIPSFCCFGDKRLSWFFCPALRKEMLWAISQVRFLLLPPSRLTIRCARPNFKSFQPHRKCPSSSQFLNFNCLYSLQYPSFLLITVSPSLFLLFTRPLQQIWACFFYPFVCETAVWVSQFDGGHRARHKSSLFARYTAKPGQARPQ
jgi:hypothetical protein